MSGPVVRNLYTVNMRWTSNELPVRLRFGLDETFTLVWYTAALLNHYLYCKHGPTVGPVRFCVRPRVGMY